MKDYLVELLEKMLFSFVEHPDDVRITSEESPRGILIKLDVSPRDMGLVIGKKGQMFQALRAILRSAGSKAGSIVNLAVSEPPK